MYSGIHYDTIAESPMTTNPEFDTKVWGTEDDEILQGALALCKKLQAKHYFTDTGGMAIKCNECDRLSKKGPLEVYCKACIYKWTKEKNTCP